MHHKVKQRIYYGGKIIFHIEKEQRQIENRFLLAIECEQVLALIPEKF